MTTLVNAPNLGQIKKQAKDLLRGFRAQNPEAANRFHAHHPELVNVSLERLAVMPLQLADSQLVIAREYGFPSWPKLKHEVDLRSGAVPLVNSRVRRENGRTWIDGVPSLKWGTDRETTFCGALEAALSVTEHPYTYAQLMGYSGLAFRTRWWQGNTQPDCCPSSPSGEFPEEVAVIGRATGWPMWTGNRLGAEEKSMAPYWPEIVGSIDEGRPVLGFVKHWDVGVIQGYVEADKAVLAWDYHEQGDEPFTMPIDKMGALIILIDEHEAAPTPTVAFVDGLKIAVANFHRDDIDLGKPGDYRYGEQALAGWASDLPAADPSQTDYYPKLFQAGWWTFDCLFDARAAAPAFLRANADLLPAEAAEYVREAAALYEQEKEILMRPFGSRDLFLGPWTGKSIEGWTPAVRQAESELLLAALAVDRKAVAALEKALNAIGIPS